MRTIFNRSRRTLQRWLVITSIFTLVMLLLFGGVYTAVIGLLPDGQQQGLVPISATVAITVVVANVIVLVMQLFGISPADFLPSPTLEERLRRENRNRYALSKSNDPKFLSEQSRGAKNIKEHDWMELYAKAWLRVEPSNDKAHEDLCYALLEAGQYHEAIKQSDKLLSVSKINFYAFQYRGEALKKLGDWENAKLNLEKALVYVPPSHRQYVLSDLVDAYERLGLIDNAISALEELIDTSDSALKVWYEDKLVHLQSIKDNLANEDPRFFRG